MEGSDCPVLHLLHTTSSGGLKRTQASVYVMVFFLFSLPWVDATAAGSCYRCTRHWTMSEDCELVLQLQCVPLPQQWVEEGVLLPDDVPDYGSDVTVYGRRRGVESWSSETARYDPPETTPCVDVLPSEYKNHARNQ